MAKPIRVLIVEDSENDALLIADQLRDNGYEPASLRVDTVDAMSEALREQVWDFVIADYKMPSFSGPEALKVLQESGLDIPFILVSGTAPENVGFDLMRSGAQDFILKGSLSRLGPAVTRSLAEAESRRERRRAEENVARLAMIVESSEDAIVGKTLDGIIASWNHGAEKMYGYAADEAVGQPFSIIVPSDRLDESAVLLSAARCGEAVSQFETQRLTKDGRRVYVSISISPIRDSDGRIVGVSTISRDITQLKLAEQREREIEAHKREFYRRTIFAATEGKLVIAEPDEIQGIAGPAIGSWQVHCLDDLQNARDEIRELVSRSGMDQARAHGFLGCTVEALANVYKHAGEGAVSLHQGPNGLTLVVADAGPGIAALSLPHVALTKGYTTAASLGMGYKIMIAFADRVYLATGPEGTTVAIQMGLDAGPAPSDVLLEKLSGL